VRLELLRTRQRLGRQAQELVADLRHEVAVAPLERGFEEVHGGAADEARDEQVGRRVVEPHRRVDLL
jgi:hypothetical protein